MNGITELTRDEREHALELYRDSIMVDCLQASVIDDGYIRRIRDSEVTCTYLGVSDLASLAGRYRLIEGNPDVVTGPVIKAGDIRRAKEEGRVAGIVVTQLARVKARLVIFKNLEPKKSLETPLKQEDGRKTPVLIN